MPVAQNRHSSMNKIVADVIWYLVSAPDLSKLVLTIE